MSTRVLLKELPAMSTRTATPRPSQRRDRRDTARRVRDAKIRTAHRRRLFLLSAVFLGVVALIGAMMWTARDTSDSTVRPAPDFTLTDTNGTTVRLADLRGRNVVLYFNEGAGCQSCILQMADIERSAAEFADANVTVLPIVMNTADQIRSDMAANGVRTPFLLDDGTVSEAYGTLGKGMHAGLPGHSFVLIDAQGMQRWYGEYPSMYLPAADLLNEIRSRID
jgi:peroxiredoxin